MDTLTLYLQQIQTYPDFRKDPRRTLRLVARMKKGKVGKSLEAQSELVKSTLRFIADLAKFHCLRFNAWQNQLDLIQEANRDVTQTIIGYEPCESSLESFVSARSYYAFVAFWYRLPIVHNTNHGRKMSKVLKAASAELRVKLDREPTLEEISQYLHMEQARIATILRQSVKTITEIDEALSQNGGVSLTFANSVQSEIDDPFELAAIAELKDDILIRALGHEDADLLLESVESGTKGLMDLYSGYTGKPMTAVNARKTKERLKKKLISYLRKAEEQARRNRKVAEAQNLKDTPNREDL